MNVSAGLAERLFSGTSEGWRGCQLVWFTIFFRCNFVGYLRKYDEPTRQDAPVSCSFMTMHVG